MAWHTWLRPARQQLSRYRRIGCCWQRCAITRTILVQVEILADAITALIEHHSRAANLEADSAGHEADGSVRELVENTIDEAVIVLSAD